MINNTAISLRNFEIKGMVKLDFLSSIINPKLWCGLLLLDFSGVFKFVNKYLFQDVTFLKFLILACAIDLLTGVTKVWVTQGLKSVTSRGLRDTVVKAISYGSFLIITHVLTHYEINGQSNTEFLWVNKVAYEFLILIEIKSVYENIIAINPKLDFITDILNKVTGVLKNKKNEGK